MSKIYVGDIGIAIRLDTKQNVSSASVKKIKYKKPNGDEGEWDATVVSNTKLQYITESGVLDKAGSWLLQAYVVLTGWTGLGDTATLTVTNPYN